jgi:hypothetical protein
VQLTEIVREEGSGERVWMSGGGQKRSVEQSVRRLWEERSEDWDVE